MKRGVGTKDLGNRDACKRKTMPVKKYLIRET
jgi:hypothetical protein